MIVHKPYINQSGDTCYLVEETDLKKYGTGSISDFDRFGKDAIEAVIEHLPKLEPFRDRMRYRAETCEHGRWVCTVVVSHRKGLVT